MQMDFAVRDGDKPLHHNNLELVWSQILKLDEKGLQEAVELTGSRMLWERPQDGPALRAREGGSANAEPSAAVIICYDQFAASLVCFSYHPLSSILELG